MNNLDRINEWRKGCSLVPAEQIKQAEQGHSYGPLCTECTIGLIKAIEKDLLMKPNKG